jgi:iron complex outermembrane receptor protein
MLLMVPLAAHAQGGIIRGRITHEGSNQPLAGVQVSFGSRSTQSQQDGQYVLTEVPAGRDSLRARLIGYAPAARSVTVTLGQTVTAAWPKSW